MLSANAAALGCLVEAMRANALIISARGGVDSMNAVT
jgi:hypothetical protein